MAIRLGQHSQLHAGRSVHHRHFSVDGVQPQLVDGLGKRLLHPKRNDGRMAVAWYSSLYRAGDERPAGAASHASDHRRRLQSAARDEFLVWDDSAAIGARTFSHWIPPAVGPKGLLGNEGCYQYYGDHALYWA